MGAATLMGMIKLPNTISTVDDVMVAASSRGRARNGGSQDAWEHTQDILDAILASISGQFDDPEEPDEAAV